MASKAARYGVDIGTGAASGAATGATIGGPWGALIGGVVGGGAGAITAAIGNADEDRAKRRMLAAQALERKQALLQLLGQQAREYGADTGVADEMMLKRGMDVAQYNQRKQFTLDNQIDPNAFVGMATSGAKLAGGLYKAGLSQPPPPQQMSQPTQIQGMPSYATLQDEGDYQVNDIDPEKLRAIRGLA